MGFDELVKYIIWIIFFGLVLFGIYFMLNRFGAI